MQPYSILSELEKVKDLDRPPVHLWHPENVKDIEMVIRKDGVWEYMSGPILRQRLVRLFSTVLRKDPDGHYYLVTPVEKCRIQVEDAPFIGVLLEQDGSGEEQVLSLTTNMAEKVNIDTDHPLSVLIDEATGEPSPYVEIRDGLNARLNRNVYYQLMDLVVEQQQEVGVVYGIWSSGTFFEVLSAPV